MIFFNHSLITFMIITVIAIWIKPAGSDGDTDTAIKSCEAILGMWGFKNNDDDYYKVKTTDKLIILNNRLFEGFKNLLIDTLNKNKEKNKWNLIDLIAYKDLDPVSDFCEYKNLKKYFENI